MRKECLFGKFILIINNSNYNIARLVIREKKCDFMYVQFCLIIIFYLSDSLNWLERIFYFKNENNIYTYSSNTAFEFTSTWQSNSSYS